MTHHKTIKSKTTKHKTTKRKATKRKATEHRAIKNEVAKPTMKKPKTKKSKTTNRQITNQKTTKAPQQKNKPQNQQTNKKFYLVFGGKLKNIKHSQFETPTKLDIIGLYPNYKKAYEAWHRISQQYVDDAKIRYVIKQLKDVEKP